MKSEATPLNALGKSAELAKSPQVVPNHDCDCEVSEPTNWLLLAEPSGERSDSKPPLSQELVFLGIGKPLRTPLVLAFDADPRQSLDAQDRCAWLCRWLK